MIRTRNWTPVLALAVGAGCGGKAPDVDSSASSGKSELALAPARVLSDSGAGYVSAMTAVSPKGLHAFVWVTNNGTTDEGTLHVETDSAPSRALPDPDGTPGLDPETPPKVAFGPGGEVYVVYYITKQLKPKADASVALRVIRSDDAGQTWSTPTNISDDGIWGTYRNDHVIHVSAAGVLSAAWMDLRNTKETRLYYARSDDRGATWSKNVAVDMDPACECCRMGVASSADGRVYIAWRKVLPGGLRDIVVASSADSGKTWSAPVLAHADNWKIDGCPDAGPSMVAEDNGRLHLAWWTGAEGRAGVRYVSSPDGGKTWGTPVPLKVGENSKPSHVQIARQSNGTVYVTWEDGLIKEPVILLATSRDNGATFETPTPVSDPGVGAGFPVVSASDRHLAMVWHQADRTVPNSRQVVARIGTFR